MCRKRHFFSLVFLATSLAFATPPAGSGVLPLARVKECIADAETLADPVTPVTPLPGSQEPHVLTYNSNAARVYHSEPVQVFLRDSRSFNRSPSAVAAYQDLLGMAASEEARSVGLKRYTGDEIRNLAAIPQFSENRGISYAVARARAFRLRKLNVPPAEASEFRELGEVISLIPEAFSRPTSEKESDASRNVAFGRLQNVVSHLLYKPGGTKKLLTKYFPETEHDAVLVDILSLVKVLEAEITPDLLDNPAALKALMRKHNVSHDRYEWLTSNEAFARPFLSMLKTLREVEADAPVSRQQAIGGLQATVDDTVLPYQTPVASLVIGPDRVRVALPEKKLGELNLLTRTERQGPQGPEIRITIDSYNPAFALATGKAIAREQRKYSSLKGGKAVNPVVILDKERTTDKYKEALRKGFEAVAREIELATGEKVPPLEVRETPPPKESILFEKNRFAEKGRPLTSIDEAVTWLARIHDNPSATGTLTARDLQRPEMAKVIKLKPGESLIREGDPGDYVYVIDPNQSSSFEISAITLPARSSILGSTAVIRGGARNATVTVKGNEEVAVLAIPKEVFRKHVSTPLSPAELARKVEAEKPAPTTTQIEWINSVSDRYIDLQIDTLLGKAGTDPNAAKTYDEISDIILDQKSIRRLMEKDFTARFGFPPDGHTVSEMTKLFLQKMEARLRDRKLGEHMALQPQMTLAFSDPALRDRKVFDFVESEVKRAMAKAGGDHEGETAEREAAWQALREIHNFNTSLSPDALIQEYKKLTKTSRDPKGSAPSRVRDTVADGRRTAVSGVPHALKPGDILEGSSFRGGGFPNMYMDAPGVKIMMDAGKTLREDWKKATGSDVINEGNIDKFIQMAITKLKTDYFPKDMAYDLKDPSKNNAAMVAAHNAIIGEGGTLRLSDLISPTSRIQGLETCRGHNAALSLLLQGAGLDARYSYVRVNTQVAGEATPVNEDHAVVFVNFGKQASTYVADGYFEQFNGWLDQQRQPRETNRIGRTGMLSPPLQSGRAWIDYMQFYPSIFTKIK